MHLLLICGSLRKRSSNRAILEAFASLLPSSVSAVMYDRAGRLPHFNPDNDREPIDPEVILLRNAFSAADIVVISTPEYAHGLPGSFKNALDWLVSDPRVAGKRVVLLGADRGSIHAIESLLEILKTMSLMAGESSVFLLPLGTNVVDPGKLLHDTSIRARLEAAVKYAQTCNGAQQIT